MHHLPTKNKDMNTRNPLAQHHTKQCKWENTQGHEHQKPARTALHQTMQVGKHSREALCFPALLDERQNIITNRMARYKCSSENRTKTGLAAWITMMHRLATLTMISGSFSGLGSLRVALCTTSLTMHHVIDYGVLEHLHTVAVTVLCNAY